MGQISVRPFVKVYRRISLISSQKWKNSLMIEHPTNSILQSQLTNPELNAVRLIASTPDP